MNEQTWKLVEDHLAEFPILKAEGVPSEEVNSASKILAFTFPKDYEEFLKRFGGAIVGAFPIFGLRQVEPMGNMWSVIDVNHRFRKKQWPGIDNWLIISMDQGGNPIGFAEDGQIWVSDHEFGEIVQVASDFEDFLVKCIKG